MWAFSKRTGQPSASGERSCPRVPGLNPAGGESRFVSRGLRAPPRPSLRRALLQGAGRALQAPGFARNAAGAGPAGKPRVGSRTPSEGPGGASGHGTVAAGLRGGGGCCGEWGRGRWGGAASNLPPTQVPSAWRGKGASPASPRAAPSLDLVKGSRRRRPSAERKYPAPRPEGSGGPISLKAQVGVG
jgi:hypothetical protein